MKQIEDKCSKTMVVGCNSLGSGSRIRKRSGKVSYFFLDQYVSKPIIFARRSIFTNKKTIIKASKRADELADQWYMTSCTSDVSQYKGHSIGKMIKVSLFYKLLDYFLFVENVSKLITESKYDVIYVSSCIYSDLDSATKDKCVRYDERSQSVLKKILFTYVVEFRKYIKARFIPRISLQGFADFVFVFDKNIDPLKNLSSYMSKHGNKCLLISSRNIEGAVNIHNSSFYVSPIFIFRILSRIRGLRFKESGKYRAIHLFANEIIPATIINSLLVKNVKHHLSRLGDTKSFITSTDVHPLSMAVITEAKRLKKKTVQIQHGSFDNSFYSRAAFLPLISDKFYVWGSMFKEVAESLGVENSRLTVPGFLLSDSWGSVDKGGHIGPGEDTLRILYISANHTGPIKYYYISQVVKAILETNIKADLVIRTHPGSNDNASFYYDLDRQYNEENLNIRLDINEALETSVSRSDLVINVGFSTTFVKLILAQKNSVAYIPFFSQKLPFSSAYIVYNKDELSQIIQSSCVSNRTREDSLIDEKYLSYASGNAALERACHYLKQGL